jgi:hypothetical protein
LADRKLYTFGSVSEWPALTPFIAGRPDEKLNRGAMGRRAAADNLGANRHGQDLADA